MNFNLSILLLTLAFTTSLCAAATGGFRTGRVELKSAGQLAFAPNGVLLIGDSGAASIVAIETGDTKKASVTPFEIKGINEKTAAMVGSAADQILIADAIVNPISKAVLLSVARGRGPDAAALIFRVGCLHLHAAGQNSGLGIEGGQ